MALTGCSRWRAKPEPTPPDYAHVSQFTASEVSRRGGNWNQVLAKPFTSKGTINASSLIATPEVATTATQVTTHSQSIAPTTTSTLSPALMQAALRAGARRAALRGVAAQVLATTDSANTSLRSLLAGQAQRMSGLETVLAAEARYDAEGATAEMATSRATVDGASLAAALKLSELVAPPSAADLAAARQRAVDLALEQAKDRLKRELLETTVTRGTTLASRFGEDAAVMNELEAMIFVLQPDSVQYAPDGSARVELYFDRNMVRDLARRHTRSRWSPLGLFAR